MDGQDAVDFANERHPDVDGRFADGAAELNMVSQCSDCESGSVTYLEIIRNIVVFCSWGAVSSLGNAGACGLVTRRRLRVAALVE